MEKDFDRWNARKKALHDSPSGPFFHPREMWFAHLGANVGFEQDGRGDEYLRPVLIIRKFNNAVFWAVPLTRVWKRNNPYYEQFQYAASPEQEGEPLLSSVAILSQLRLLDVRRLRYKIGTVSETEVARLKEKIRRLLA